MSVAGDIIKIKNQIPEDVTLVAVSKTKPYDVILEAYRTGHRIFGENKVQELVDKHEHLPKDIEWHFIGHLQTNKVKYLVPFIHLIHGIDSMKLLSVVNKEGAKLNRIIDCLLQIRIAREETKFGLSEAEAEEILKDAEFREFKNVRIKGLMGMATYTDDMELVRTEFRKLSTIFNTLSMNYFAGDTEFNELSMGMSHDYAIAIEEGATLIRIGSSIFGERNYTIN
jgi:pyridoxal phosphate enzyme (YggS family)